MKTKKTISAIAVLMLITAAGRICAQDLHLSQYDAAPVILNPSLTGMFDEQKYRGATQFRSQWSPAGCNYTTTTFSYDMYLNERWGVGGYIINDDASQFFNSFSFVLSGAYRISEPGQKKLKLYTGLQLGLINKSTKDYKLVFDNQYDNGNFDPDLPSGENFANLHRLLPEVNYGIYYEGAYNEDKLFPYAGFTISHITYPKQSFCGSPDSHLPLKYLLHAGARYLVNEDFTINPKFLFMKQRTATEIMPGINLMYDFKDKEMTGMLGFNYRIKDAAIFNAGFRYKNVSYLLSYDMTVSYLKEYTHTLGGLEFAVVFNK
ncbi:MAG: PorP/SprF family type IX secretion system membrane protein [Bacteroidota bacterium]